MIQIAVLVAALVCQSTPAKDPPIDWSAPNSETPAPKPLAATPASPSADVGVLGFPRKPPQTGGDFLRSQAQTQGAAPPPPASPSVADLFRERNAREAAAKAAEAGQANAVPDGTYHCRRTENGLTCGTDEEGMKRSEEAAKAQLDRLLAPN